MSLVPSYGHCLCQTVVLCSILWMIFKLNLVWRIGWLIHFHCPGFGYASGFCDFWSIEWYWRCTCTASEMFLTLRLFNIYMLQWGQNCAVFSSCQVCNVARLQVMWWVRSAGGFGCANIERSIWVRARLRRDGHDTWCVRDTDMSQCHAISGYVSHINGSEWHHGSKSNHVCTLNLTLTFTITLTLTNPNVTLSL